MKSRYKDESEALEAVEAHYRYWSGRLTESSFQLCLGIIAANWAVYRDVHQIRNNPCALWSLGIVIFTLGLSLLSAKRMSEAHREQCERAEQDPKRWEDEFRDSQGKRTAWPFTEEIENIGWITRSARAYLPLASGLIFIIGLF